MTTHLAFIVASITHTYLHTIGSADTKCNPTLVPTLTTIKEYTDISVQTSDAEFVSQIPLATYINIRKCLNELQCQQRLENQHSIGTDTETNTVDIGINTHNSFGFDISAWLDSPYQTPEWLSQLYEEEEEPSAESARLNTLREIFQSDSKYITASELTSESPPTHTQKSTRHHCHDVANANIRTMKRCPGDLSE